MIPRIEGHVGKALEIKGTAYDFGKSIAAIQFSLDQGAHWTTYETKDTNDYQNLAWTFCFTPEQAGSYQLLVRSINETGEASPEAAHVELMVAEA